MLALVSGLSSSSSLPKTRAAYSSIHHDIPVLVIGAFTSILYYRPRLWPSSWISAPIAIGLIEITRSGCWRAGGGVFSPRLLWKARTFWIGDAGELMVGQSLESLEFFQIRM